MASSPWHEKAPRKRGPNYTEAEKEYLRVLVKRHYSVIESKCTGTMIFKEKADAWMQVAESYNACSTSGIRTSEQLKHLYENLKQQARKAHLASSHNSDYLRKLEEEKAKRAEALETFFQSSNNEMILEVNPLKFLDRSDEEHETSDTVTSVNLMDHVYKVEIEENELEPVEVNTVPTQVETAVDPTTIAEVISNNHRHIERLENASLDNVTIPESNREKCQPATLRTKVSNKSEVSPKARVKTKLERMRLNLVQLELLNTRRKLQFMKEEHKLKILQMKEQHSLKMLSLSNDERRKQELHEVMLQNNFSNS